MRRKRIPARVIGLIDTGGRNGLRALLLCAVVGVVWIAVSDGVVQALGGPAPASPVVRWLEALAYASVGAAVVYWILRGELRGRRAARAALEETEFRFRQLIGSASDIIHVIDVDGRIGYMSPSVERILGYRAEEMVGRMAYELVHPEDHGFALEAFRETIGQPGTMRDLELRLRHRDGHWRTFEVIVKSIIEPTGATLGIVNSRDVTDEKRAEAERAELERQLHHSQKMEAIGRLAGGVAHDFNNVLTVISSYADFLLQEYRRDGRIRSDVMEIKRAVQRASSLTRQLLAFSRQQVLQPKVLDLNAVMLDMERMLRRILREDIELVTILDPALGRMRADRSQIEQVIMNLAVNAGDAMPEGGRLTIETRNVSLDEGYRWRFSFPVRPGPYIMLAVTDTGVGMTPDVQERIFEPFFTTKEPGKGTGLGLSTVYGIVKQSGGYIWAYSEPGVGSTFKAFLPRVSGPVAAPAPSAGTPAGELRGGETILLVEDDRPVRTTIRRALEGFGYTVLEAGGPVDAIELAHFHRDRIDLVITDLVLPTISGRRLVERLRNILPAAPVIFISGYTQEARMRPETLEPGTIFLQKPFSPRTLAVKVREALGAPGADPSGS